MSGDQALTTLLIGAAVVGTGGAALGVLAPTLLGGAAATATTAATSGFFAANLGTFAAIGAFGSAGLSILQGNQQAQALKFEKQQLQEQKDREKVQAAIDKADREARLSDILSSQTAMFATRGIMLGSGVAERAEEVSVGASNREDSLGEFNSLFRQRQLTNAADQKTLEAKAARTNGYINAGRTLFSAAQSGYLNG